MDPYEVLGVSHDADEATIKKAYHELVKKYHPDRYVNSPLADMASEKMKEINKAYDMITNKNTASNQNGSYGGYGRQGYGNTAGGNYNTASFQNVRTLISMGALQQALMMLNSLPRTAEWYYLSGVVRIRMGWYDEGISFIKTAVNMEPNNAEYRAAMDNINNRNEQYTYTSQQRTAVGCCPCDCTGLCSTLCCLNMCCGC